MKEYIITVATAAVVAAIADILAPGEWSKYIRVIVGFLILSVLIAPIAKFRGTEILSPTGTYNISDEPLKDKVSQQLRENVEKDIEERILEEFDIRVKASVQIDIDEEHNIRGVEAIEITTWKNPDGLEERLKNVYGCDKIELKFE